MIDQYTAIAVGSNGIISRTQDGGDTWETAFEILQIKGALNAIVMTSDDHGWIVGDSGVVLYTDDGGRSWTLQESGVHVNLHDLVFLDQTTGWAVGDSGVVIRTIDGGESWQIQETGINRSLTSVDFISAEEGWAVGWFDNVLHTEDGGTSWVLQGEGFWALSWVDFQDSLTGWVSTQDQCMDASCGSVFKTVDGGFTWTKLPGTSHLDPFFGRIGFFNDSVGWGLDWWYDGWGARLGTDIYLTHDGGDSWKPHLRLIEEELLAVDFYDNTYALAVGTGGLTFRSGDGGETWERLVSTANLKSVHFINREIGWAAGGSGAVLHTSDGGLEWEVQNSGSLEDLNAIYFSTQDSGWAVGNSGLILKTVNGGESWFSQESGIDFPILSVHFVDSQSGWATASKGYYYEPTGLILHTPDGGNTWNRQESTPGSRVEDVMFVDHAHGFAVGNVTQYPVEYSFYGVNYRTIDGGETWIADTLDFDSQLTAVTFVDSLSGWVVGQDLTTVSTSHGIVLRTVDGGLTWSKVFSDRGISLTDVYFADRDRGWLVDSRGSIFSTRDAGNTWSKFTYERWHPLNSLHFVDSQTGWVVGYNGLILKTTDGGLETVKGNGPMPMPKVFRLFQNYPNPFNPTTTIEFSVPQAGLVTLTVYDLLGREVETILNQQVDPGRHKVQWNATGIPSGIYIVRMQAGDPRHATASGQVFTQSRKVTVLR